MSNLKCSDLMWGLMTDRQQLYLERLSSSTSHPVVVSEASLGGNMEVHLPFPGLYLTVDICGNLLRTETSVQRHLKNPSTQTMSHSSESKV